MSPLIRIRMENDSFSRRLNNEEEKAPHGNKSYVSGGLVSSVNIYH